MIDSAKVLYEYLTTAGTSLYTLNGDNVWTVQGEPIGWNNGTTGIMIELNEASNYSAKDWVQADVTFMCYGGNDNKGASFAIYAALNDRLNGAQSQIQTSGTIEWAQQTGGDPDEIETDSGYNRAMATYTIQLKEN